MQTFTGYMAHADWDGTTLTIVGHNRAARMAIAGESWEQDVVLTRDQIATVTHSKPNAVVGSMVNGRVTITTTAGLKHVVHFRKKTFGDLDALVAVLSEQPVAAVEQPAVPAGWYPLDGEQRYWDGTGWTEHTAPLT